MVGVLFRILIHLISCTKVCQILIHHEKYCKRLEYGGGE